VGIDRFMSEARALTNFAGNAVATVLIGSMTSQFDAAQARKVFSGESPFDEATLQDEQAQSGPAPANKPESITMGVRRP
jgi:aerobic C4-dicarboxylate transport protein